MTDTLYPANTLAGQTLTGRQLRQATSPLTGGATAARPLGARSGVRPQLTAAIVTATSTTWTVNAHSGILDLESNTGAGPYGYATEGGATGSVTAADGTNPRVDIVWVRSNDNAEDTTGQSQPTFGYTVGTPASVPSPPSPPVRAMTLVNIAVPKSGGGAPTVTLVAPYASAPGAWIYVRTDAERTALTGGTPDCPLLVLVASNDRYWSYDGTTWTALSGPQGMIYDSTYGWIPEQVGGDAVITLTAGVGAQTLPFGKTYVGVEKYVWTVWNSDGLSQNCLYVTSTHPIGTGSKSSIDFRYSGAAAGSARLAWMGVYRA